MVRSLVDPGYPSGRELLLDEYHNSYVDLRRPAKLVYPYTQWVAHAIDATFPRQQPLHGVFVGVVLIGSDRALPAGVADQADGSLGYARPAVSAFAADVHVLRDDYAPVDQLLTSPDL